MRRRRGTCVAVMLVALASASCAARLSPGAPVVTPDGVRFVLEQSQARSVTVAGSFNDWSDTSHPLARDARSGLWTATVVLPPGEHQFMFVVDDTEWVSPPLAEDYVDDGFGARNGVVIVRPAG